MCLAVSTRAIPGDLAQKLAAIAEAGFGGVELHESDLTAFDGSPSQIRDMASDFGLRICLLQPFHNLECQPRSKRQSRFDRLKRKLDLMNALGTDLLLVGSAFQGHHAATEDQVIVDLGAATQIARAMGLRLACLGLPWSRFAHSDEQALRVIKTIDDPHLGLALNSFFSLADGSRLARLRDIPAERLYHVQLSDAPRPEMDIRKLKRCCGLLPGLGSLNLAGFVRVLARAGYKGPWSIAHINEAAPRPGGRTLARDSYRSLVSLLDLVSRTGPATQFGIPDLPERIYASGIEFVEFAVDEKSGAQLADMLSAMCFRMERKHVSKSVELWRQGAINIVVNTEREGFAHTAFQDHGPSVCDVGLRVRDADQTVQRATALGAPHFSQTVGRGEVDIPAICGVGGNIVHFIDEKSDLHRVWDIEFEPVAKTKATQPAGLRRIDHLAQTMRHDEMQGWLLYYISTFNMAKSPVVNVADPSGIVQSQAIESPGGEVRLNLNGAIGHRTLAASFLEDGFGAGVQHIAFQTDDIFETSDQLLKSGFPGLSVPENYYADLHATFGLDDELIARLRNGNILYDRAAGAEYFQIYGRPVFNGFFFEIVERRTGYNGYGARNASIRLAAQKKTRPAKEAQT